MQTEEGRKYLKENGINPDLLRLSVWLENPDEVYEVIRDTVNKGK
jgi:cystathionine beta-lyase/cystathionine gamma-synthase